MRGVMPNYKFVASLEQNGTHNNFQLARYRGTRYPNSYAAN